MKGRSPQLALLASLLVFAPLAFATAPQAKPFHGDGYPRFRYEGQYPDATPCSYRLVYSRQANRERREITLKYFYSDSCGSFARIENAPRNCSVILDRTPSRNTNTYGWVMETVDPGINFAYTQVGNNLSGRLSRGSLVCGEEGLVVTSTPWY